MAELNLKTPSNSKSNQKLQQTNYNKPNLVNLTLHKKLLNKSLHMKSTKTHKVSNGLIVALVPTNFEKKDGHRISYYIAYFKFDWFACSDIG